MIDGLITIQGAVLFVFSINQVHVLLSCFRTTLTQGTYGVYLIITSTSWHKNKAIVTIGFLLYLAFSYIRLFLCKCIKKTIFIHIGQLVCKRNWFSMNMDQSVDVENGRDRK